MDIKNLHLENIGPFKIADLEFTPITEGEDKPIIIITGENGTGKSIIIDAIRSLFLGITDDIERDITAENNFKIIADLEIDHSTSINLMSNGKNTNGKIDTNNYEFNKLFSSHSQSKYEGQFVINYWSSKLSHDKFNISHIETPVTKNFLHHSLSGIHTNVEVTKLITFFDYLSDSKDKSEKLIGVKMYDLIKKIIESSIHEGHLSHISRTKLQPIISINNREISLDKLSSGNLYLIQRLIHLLKQMYACSIINNIPINDIQLISGLLLIDEAENHLHPKWQKTFLKSLNSLFPNLQIIVTTHSPFIVSSVENARIYVCKSETDFSIVVEETDFYSNKPVEEILLSPLFNTSNFNVEISELLSKRKDAIQEKNAEEIKRIESLLLNKNPEYFNYLNIEEILKTIKK
ncbi:AAA family ATPase [Flavobacterium sp. ST-87]|uniref:AAA family ATPase n=1 Tax=Flavobacterium plantiphilum TaxID=3163297 RepID=A0ABW8XPY8_9FLAO